MSLEQINRLLDPLRKRLANLVARAIVRLVADDKNLQELQLEVLKGELRDRCERFQEYGFTSVPLPGAEAVAVFVGGNRDHPIVLAVDDRRYRMKNLIGGEVAIYTDEGDYVHFKRGREIHVVAGNKVTVDTKVAEVNAEDSATVNTDVAEVNAETSATVTSPLVNVVASTQVEITSPLVTMSGQLQVTGAITGTGGLAVSGGSGAQVTGNIVVSGDVSDANGSMAEMRTTYNGHTHPENGTGGGTTSAPNQPMS